MIKKPNNYYCPSCNSIKIQNQVMWWDKTSGREQVCSGCATKVMKIDVEKLHKAVLKHIINE